MTLDTTPEIAEEQLQHARELIADSGWASQSLIQLKLQVGYAKANNILRKLCEEGIVREHTPGRFDVVQAPRG